MGVQGFFEGAAQGCIAAGGIPASAEVQQQVSSHYTQQQAARTVCAGAPRSDISTFTFFNNRLQVANDIAALSRVKPKLPWSADDGGGRKPGAAAAAKARPAAGGGGKGGGKAAGGFGKKGRR